MSCPFGFVAERGGGCDADDECAEQDVPLKAVNQGAAGAAGTPDVDPRKSAAWFYQNQVRCEEEFQRNKSKLRKEARKRLDVIFEKKNKALVVDTDEDTFSIASSELSAWDSDVHSLASIASCADSWLEQTSFAAPAQTTLGILLAVLAAVATFSVWKALAAMDVANQYWGLIRHGWTPIASAVVGITSGSLAIVCWAALQRRSKRLLFAFQLIAQVLYVAAAGLAVAAVVEPAHMEHSVKAAACRTTAGSSNRLCTTLPLMEAALAAAMHGMALGNGAVAATLVALLVCSTWANWELGVLTQKVLKHKRRRRLRKRSIPWDKIKVEDIGPITYCGTAAPPLRAMPNVQPLGAASTTAQAASTAAKAASGGHAHGTRGSAGAGATTPKAERGASKKAD